ncbi:hypothetical protein GE061_009618 [Apolygus lucorum]|uniref:Uncharacterized protein n=1 Tax=Apolygus lucorum TaxID=248454 RepID=A0A8S9Y216_APOLU|nr:hypothetical protein GE061_009618 [Apolygus lucorum]
MACKVPLQTDYEVLFECISYCKFLAHDISGRSLSKPTKRYSLFGARIDHSHNLPQFFKLQNNVLVTVHYNLMQVFTKQGKYTRKLVALFDKDPLLSRPVPKSLYLVAWFRRTWNNEEFRFITATCDHNGKYFVGTLRHAWKDIYPTNYYHIWDLETFTKIKRVELPHLQDSIINVTFSVNKSTVGLNMTTEFLKTVVYCCDIEKNCQSSSLIKRNYEAKIVLFTENLVIMSDWGLSMIFIFDFMDNNHRLCFETPEDLDPFCISVSSQPSGDLLLYCSNQKSCSQITIYDLTTLSCVSSFSLPEVYTNVFQLYVFLEDLMLLGTDAGLMIYDLKSHTLMSRIEEFTVFLPPERNGTMMVAYRFEDDRVCQPVVLHFW